MEIIIHDLISRSCVFNPAGPLNSRKIANCDDLQSLFRINPAPDYQPLPRRGLTVSSADFHWAGNSVRELNQSAVDATRLSRRAGSRDASSDRPYAGKLGRRARRRTAWNPCAFSNAWSGCYSARTLCRIPDICEVSRLQQKGDKKCLEGTRLLA